MVSQFIVNNLEKFDISLGQERVNIPLAPPPPSQETHQAFEPLKTDFVQIPTLQGQRIVQIPYPTTEFDSQNAPLKNKFQVYGDHFW